jgi:hypothetical protein
MFEVQGVVCILVPVSVFVTPNSISETDTTVKKSDHAIIDSIIIIICT